ncbi:uncharacterized protein LOC127796001 [Diospyros lotus]|uniref:uncharacterized protein LOC127796001 n=1 Tax=Diospyros lotus TaxID=55363 RepID=UPI002250C565|nr:uncharacterized protein LOC127796001 [Diospyros lotus]
MKALFSLVEDDPAGQMKKISLLCSFNGAFRPRPPPSGELRYTGGDTRIIAVDRNIGFSRLRSKVSEFLDNDASFTLKYRLPVEEDEAPLVLVACDDDVRCMLEEYERLESRSKLTRLWIFVCHHDGYGSFDYRNSNVESAVFRKSKSICYANGDGIRGGNLISNSGECEFGGYNVGNLGTRSYDDSLRRMLLKQQLLAKQSVQESFDINLYMASVNLKYDQPFIDLKCEPQGPLLIHEAADLNFDGNICRASHLDYEFWNTQLQTDNSSGSRLDGTNNASWSASRNSVKTRPAPVSCCCQLVGSTNPTRYLRGSEMERGALYGGIHTYQFAATDTISQRTCSCSCSCHIQNHQYSVTEIGNHQNFRLEGRPWIQKLYPGSRSTLNMSKRGQAMRLRCPSLEGSGRRMDSVRNNQDYLCEQPYGSEENFSDMGGPGIPHTQAPNPKQYHLPVGASYTGLHNQSLLSTSVNKIPLISNRAMDMLENPLTGYAGDKHESPCTNMHRVPLSSQLSHDFKKASLLMKLTEPVKISICPSDLDSTKATKLGCNGKLSGKESGVNLLGNHHNSAFGIQGALASSMDLTLCNIALSSSNEFESTVHSSPTNKDVSEALPKPQSKTLELMNEEEHLSSGPQVETSNGVVSDSISQKVSKLKVDELKIGMQREHPSSLSVDGKVSFKESPKCSKANGSAHGELGAIYTHLACRELQDIKNCDLEYVKELGSGTYGTVLYGKWKGSDVAIKKFKPSCFAEGAPECERLVADFWKEARILGQLRHPRIVVLYGVVADGPVTNLATVTEYMVNGSLKQVLQKKDRTIDRRKRLIIAMDVAFGMEYLHGKNIVHFDLKSHNLLVNMRDPQRPVCKIGDFGLSKIKQRTMVSGGLRGTIPWMAPELFDSDKNMVTEKVDVYSFGIVMWELLTGEEPYGNKRPEEILAGIIKGDLRPEIPSWCDPAWRSLMERCWSCDPNSRPAFSEVSQELRAMSVAMNIK